MRLGFKPSFDKSLKSLPGEQKARLIETCFAFFDLLEARAPLPAGIGLKRLRGDFWEIRHGQQNRILFRWKDELIEFVLAGDHDSIEAFLKNI